MYLCGRDRAIAETVPEVVRGGGDHWAFPPSFLPAVSCLGQPTPVFLPGESQGRGSLVGCRLWGRTESDTTEVT